ncbi:UDP-glucose-4-epimerase GalE [Bradyrhizobium sp. GM24.11]
MPILVTGGAGYIGSQTVSDLVDAGEMVVVLDDLSTGFEAAVSPNARLVVGDVGDAMLVSSLIAEHNIDAIIHFAGSIVVPESIADPLHYYLNNTSKTRSLIEAAVGGRVPHFIFSSTAAVYDSKELLPVREGDPVRPQSPYGRSKLISEWMLEDVSRVHPLRYTVLRYFNVAGADPQKGVGQATKGASHLIKVASEAALGKRQFVEGIRYGLSNARRDLHSRLPPRQGSRGCSSACSCPASERRIKSHGKLRLRSRLFGHGGAPCNRADRWNEARHPQDGAARRRFGRSCGRPEPRAI